MSDKPVVEIHFCTRCQWLLRAGWMAQELLQTFPEELGGVLLKPGTGGVFQIGVGDERIWCRKEDGGFPELPELKRRVRDHACPGRDLGHIDRAARQD